MQPESDQITKGEGAFETESSTMAGGTGAGAAPARQSLDAEATNLMLSKVINERIGKHQNLTLNYQGKEITVTGLRHDGIKGRDETGADVIVPFEWPYLKDLFSELVTE